MDAHAVVGAAGIGAEPASCTTVAGCRKLVAAGVIGRGESVAGILTGHVLKDTDSVVGYHAGTLPGVASTRRNEPVTVSADLDRVLAAIGRAG